jgi:anti-sigma factor RsiW
MNCDDIFEVILASGELDSAMEEHVAECEECAELRRQCAQLEAEGETERQRDISPEAVREVMRLAREVQEERVSPPHTQMREWWLLRSFASIAAAIIVIGGCVVAVQRLISSSSAPQAQMPLLEVATSAEVDMLRSDVKREVAAFSARHERRITIAGTDHDMMLLRSRINSVSVGLEQELASFANNLHGGE